MTYPSQPVDALRRQLEELEIANNPSPPLFADAMLLNFRLLGYFPTANWNDDPAMPDYVSYHKYRLGYYHVADFDLRDAAGSVLCLTAVINDGDADCNSGYWGGIFQRNDDDDEQHVVAVAQIISSGDMETTVQTETGFTSSFTEYDGSDLVFPLHKEVSEGEEAQDYFSGLSPGFCSTQFEKLLGVAMHTIVTAQHEWSLLPTSLTRENIR